MRKKKTTDHEVCPCGSGKILLECCGPLLSLELRATTAVELMRSRFTAYAHKDVDYLVGTWAPETCPGRTVLELDEGVKWLDLRILEVQDGGKQDERGVVRFGARFKRRGKAGKLIESSRFERRGGEWIYVEGEIE